MRLSTTLVVTLVLSLACGGAAEEGEPPEDPVPIGVDTGTPEVEPAPPRARKPRRPGPPRAPLEGPADPVEPEPEPQPDPAPPPPAGGEDDEKGAKRPVGEKPSGIEKTGDKSWSVRKNLADRYKDDPYLLANNVEQQGEGWALKGVRQKDAYHLGIRNSDVVLEVNGKKLETQAQLMTAWLTLKNKSSYDVLILRDGQRRTHHYDVVD